jgi:hypothetical protein
MATVFHCMGFEPETILRDIEGRPFPISRGQVIPSLVS